jgi:hypothetical protein
MKLGIESDVPAAACTNCGRVNNAATVVNEIDAGPSPGDVTVCMYCGHIMAFAKDLSLRDLTTDEMVEVAGDPRVIAIQKARAGLALQPHAYVPSAMHMGDCLICGHLQGAAIHSPFRRQ